MAVTLYEGDNRQSLRKLIDQGVRVHSVVTDPPYALTSITKRFGKDGSAAARRAGNDGSFSRLSGGFMGMKWDATGIERDPEFWKLIYEILLPGGYVFAFSGARTGHWQACAMEQAGFIMHPMHGWVYGQGWNKPTKVNLPGWEGWGYGTQAQKPALEPIYLGQRPFSEKTGPANILKHGVGAVNLDACRVPVDATADSKQLRTMSRGQRVEDHNDHSWGHSKNGGDVAQVVDSKGRQPANLILDGSPEVTALFPDSKGQRAAVKGDEPSDVTKDIYGKFGARVPAQPRNDSGSASRFFHNFPYTEDDYLWWIDAGLIGPDQGDAILYHAKAGKQDRAGSKHPTVKPIGLLENLIRHITPKAGIVLDPFAGSGTTAEAAKRMGFNCILMEAEKSYVEFINTRFDLKQDDEEGIYSSADKPRQREPQGGNEHENLIDFDVADRVSGPTTDGALVYDLVDLLGDTPFERADTPRGYETVERGRSDSDTDLADLLC